MLEPWCKALNLNQKNFEELKDQAPAGCSPLFYGLRSGVLDFATYRDWASKTFKLPFMMDDALNNISLLTQIQTYCGKSQLKFNHGHESIAFYEYNNIKYIACFYPEHLVRNKNEFLILVTPTTFEIFKTFNANIEVSEVYEFTNTNTSSSDKITKKAG